MRIMRVSGLLAGALLTFGIAALSASCKPIAGGYCDKLCDCAECYTYYRDQCIETVKRGRASAGDAGCGSQFDEYLSCNVSRVSCESGTLHVEGACEAERDALAACDVEGALSCELAWFEATRHTAECGVVFDTEYGMMGCPNDDPYYYVDTACYSKCAVEASCGALTGEDEEARELLYDCYNNCSGF